MIRTLRIDGIDVFACRDMEQGFLFAGESHAEAELVFVEQGEIHCVADGRDRLLRSGDLILYGPNQWHMQYADTDDAPRITTILFSVEGRDLSELTDRILTPEEAETKLLKAILAEQENPADFSGDMAAAALTMLLMLLLRRAVKNPTPRPTGVNETDIIRRAQQFIALHARDKMSVASVAEGIDVSASYLTILFRKHLHISPGDYIRRVKLEESRRMIREGQWNFTEIARVLQYSTVHHFSRQFRDKFGMTPSEYARSSRQ